MIDMDLDSLIEAWARGEELEVAKWLVSSKPDDIPERAVILAGRLSERFGMGAVRRLADHLSEFRSGRLA